LLAEAGTFYLCDHIQTGSSSLLSNGYKVLSLQIKKAEHEAGYLPTFSAKIKNVSIYQHMLREVLPFTLSVSKRESVDIFDKFDSSFQL
jgi:hypothetical protein